MSNDQMISAPRALLEQFLAGGRPCDQERLRALLDRPAKVEFSTPDCPDCACVQDGHCLCIPSKPAAQPQGEVERLRADPASANADKAAYAQNAIDLRALLDKPAKVEFSTPDCPDCAYVQKELAALRRKIAQLSPEFPQPELTVWYGKMPESNGKSNWTAILYRKGEGGFMGRLSEGITIARSEYEDRVRYEADRMRYLIGELAVEPDILAYDANLRSDYVYPPNALEARITKLEEALAFYADGDHFMVTNEDAWEECGEALPNFSRDDEGTAYVEDGSTAKTALEGKV